MENKTKIPEFLMHPKEEIENKEESIGSLKEKSEKEDTLIFFFEYGSYFDGSCEFLIVDNQNESCKVLAEGYNGYDLCWNFELPIENLKLLEKTVKPARKWLKYYESQEEIFDGYGWTLIFIGKDYKINTGGYMANPFNYFRVARRILKLLYKFKQDNTKEKENEKKLLSINGYKDASFYIAHDKHMSK